MAAQTILDAVTVDSVGASFAVTGDFEASMTGDTGGGVCELQRAVMR